VSNNFILNITPQVKFSKNGSYLLLSSDFSMLNAKYSGISLPEEKVNSKFFWFPKAEIQIATDQGFKFYGGVDGGLRQNSYSGLLKENPYLISDQILKPTETKYHFYVGLKGDVNESLKYDVSAGFSKAKNILFYSAHNLIDFDMLANRKPYDFANTFSATYDDGNISTIKGSLQYFPLEDLRIDAELDYTTYKLDHTKTIYNKPVVTANIGAKYSMLNKKLLLGFKTYFVSDRTTNAYALSEDLSLPNFYISQENTDHKVGGYADLNLSAEYKIHKNFSIFALGNNLLNTKYQTFNGYKVLGAQITGGVKITF